MQQTPTSNVSQPRNSAGDTGLGLMSKVERRSLQSNQLRNMHVIIINISKFLYFRTLRAKITLLTSENHSLRNRYKDYSNAHKSPD